MNRILMKSVLRSIRQSLGRYLAIFAIIALGCGFFSGLRICRDAMVKTGEDYLNDLCFYDFRILSGIGFDGEDVQAVRELDGVASAEGMFSADAVLTFETTVGDTVFHVMSLPEQINLPHLTAGRLPTAPGECLADSRRFSQADIGKTFTVSDTGEGDSPFLQSSFTIVGIASSPVYLNSERGTTSIGTGSVYGFLYVLPECFTSQVYTELCVTVSGAGALFSEEYEQAVKTAEPAIRKALSDRVVDRSVQILEQASEQKEATFAPIRQQLDDAKAQLDQVDYQSLANTIRSLRELQETSPTDLIAGMLKNLEQIEAEYLGNLEKWEASYAEYTSRLEEADARLAELSEQLERVAKTPVYVLTRNENVGYVCFDNDSSIVEGISLVFPVFFILLAALICSTTMSRMVSEERTQNGVLMALGFSSGTVYLRYAIYAGSAAVIGSVSGYFLGIVMIPKLIWKVYDIMYGFTAIKFVFDPVLLAISLLGSILCSVGVACLSCRSSLREMPASLIRPVAPKSAKRILLERIPPLWKRLSFLQKVSMRNIFRYKKRFFMMVLGIAGCCALLITGFGIRDSVSGIADNQFDRIALYDLSVSFHGGLSDEEIAAFSQDLPDAVTDTLFLTQSSWEALGEDGNKTVNVLISTGDRMDSFLHFASNDKPVAYPGEGEVILDKKLAGILGVSTGDRLTLRDSEYTEYTVTVSGIFDNYVNNYVCMTPETYRSFAGELPAVNSALMNLSVEAEAQREVAAELMRREQVASVSVNYDLRSRVNEIMARLDYIVLLVLVCAGALALIVLYHLTNMNISERAREIATLKVLGFNRRETASYVFRENAVLTVLGAVCGIPLGFALHAFVMSQIVIDLISFDRFISILSCLISVGITFLFAVAVGYLLRFRIDRISMADSLKSVE